MLDAESDEKEKEEDLDIDDLDAVDAADQRVQDLADDRAWVETCLSVVVARKQELDLSGRVQLALDLVCIAACERMGRILRSDLSNDKG
jgi:hypothetical protein